MSEGGPADGAPNNSTNKSPKVPSLWWLGIGAWQWSSEERWVRALLAAISLVVSFILLFFEVGVLLALGVERHLAAGISFFLALIPALLVARPICARLWPEVLNRAEEKAENRLARQRMALR